MVSASFQPSLSWLRIGPLWAAAAGALSLPLSQWDAGLWLRVLAALVLADPIWGVFWHTKRPPIAQDGAAALPNVRGPIPYASPGSPAARLASWLRMTPEPGAVLSGHPVAGWPLALVLALLLALPLGTVALGLTGVVLALSLLRLVWTGHDRSPPAVLDASLIVGLPWVLGMAVVLGVQPAGVVQAAAFTILLWGVLRAEQNLHHARTLMILGQIAVLAVLVWQGRPLAAGLVGASFVMPWWLLAWSPGTLSGSRALHAAQPWLLGAMLLSVVIRS